MVNFGKCKGILCLEGIPHFFEPPRNIHKLPTTRCVFYCSFVGVVNVLLKKKEVKYLRKIDQVGYKFTTYLFLSSSKSKLKNYKWDSLKKHLGLCEICRELFARQMKQLLFVGTTIAINSTIGTVFQWTGLVWDFPELAELIFVCQFCGSKQLALRKGR